MAVLSAECHDIDEKFTIPSKAQIHAVLKKDVLRTGKYDDALESMLKKSSANNRPQGRAQCTLS